jgi:hypothetical protein
MLAICKLAVEAKDNGPLAAGIGGQHPTREERQIHRRAERIGNWLSLKRAEGLVSAPDIATLKELRDAPSLRCSSVVHYAGPKSQPLR